MANGFLESLHRFEAIAFFSGYPMMYAVFRSFMPQRTVKHAAGDRLLSLWPVAYGLLGALYLGLQLRNLHLDRFGGALSLSPWTLFLTVWGVSAIFFWTPALVKRPALSFWHSLVFFSLISKDLLQQLSGSDKDGGRIWNDMQMYGVSLVLAIGAFLFVAFCHFVLGRWNRPSRR